ncbi:MAG: dCTP deaminase [Oscillospiraceae bacterium]|jgi:dCTP deaminase|nr:dCTP deaminase [Oscillospiraceae bacterium]
MILSGLEILRQMDKGTIEISPFDKRLVNPNSVNLRLNDRLLVYSDPVLDMKRDNPTRSVTIPREGIVLTPGALYLGRTLEYTRTDCFVPMLEGRSSIGRLGLYIHVTAGFGDVGFKGFWTLEMHCIHPIRIYPFVSICQIYYHSIEGDYVPYTSGKYQGNTDVEASKMYKEFNE